jgi:hypothetical protein
MPARSCRVQGQFTLQSLACSDPVLTVGHAWLTHVLYTPLLGNRSSTPGNVSSTGNGFTVALPSGIYVTNLSAAVVPGSNSPNGKGFSVPPHKPPVAYMMLYQSSRYHLI